MEGLASLKYGRSQSKKRKNSLEDLDFKNLKGLTQKMRRTESRHSRSNSKREKTDSINGKD